MKSLTSRKNSVNKALHALGLIYHQGLPIQEITDILNSNGFNGEIMEGIYCGHDGRISENLTDRIGFNMTWHRMPSGRFEIVAYIS